MLNKMSLAAWLAVLQTRSDVATGFLPLAPRFQYRGGVLDAEASSEKYVNPVTAFLGSFLSSPSPGGGQASAPVESLVAPGIDFASIEWGAKKAVKLPATAMAQRLDEGLRDREWCVSLYFKL
jgi:hypothetical protein